MKKHTCYKIEDWDNKLFLYLDFLSNITADDNSQGMQYIYVEKDNIVATDGRILAVLKHTLDSGYYKRENGNDFPPVFYLFKQKTPEIVFPKWKKVIPDVWKKGWKVYGFDFSDISGEKIIYTLGRTGELPKLNPYYLSMLPKDRYSLYYQEKSETVPVVFVSKTIDFKITLMPLRY